MHNPALDLIRRCTAPLHAKLDKASSLTKIANPDCSLTEYQQAMYGLALTYQQIDTALLAAAAHCPVELPTYESRMPYLLEDLRHLGIPAPEVAGSLLSPPSSAASYLGMRYVIEGSNLGAKVIASNLSRAKISSQINHANRFWSGTNPWHNCWPIMLKQLAALQSRSETAQAARAARRTFRHFTNCLLVKQG